MLQIKRLRAHRRHWALTQEQLATLLSLKARSVVARHEREGRPSSLHHAFAYQFIFGVPLEELFPQLVLDVHERVLARAALLDEALRGRDDATAARIAELLGKMVERTSNPAAL